MMAHPHIVQFVECFEDQENVYMLLDLCPYGVSTFFRGRQLPLSSISSSPEMLWHGMVPNDTTLPSSFHYRT